MEQTTHLAACKSRRNPVDFPFQNLSSIPSAGFSFEYDSSAHPRFPALFHFRKDKSVARLPRPRIEPMSVALPLNGYLRPSSFLFPFLSPTISSPFTTVFNNHHIRSLIATLFSLYHLVYLSSPSECQRLHSARLVRRRVAFFASCRTHHGLRSTGTINQRLDAPSSSTHPASSHHPFHPRFLHPLHLSSDAPHPSAPLSIAHPRIPAALKNFHFLRQNLSAQSTSRFRQPPGFKRL